MARNIRRGLMVALVVAGSTQAVQGCGTSGDTVAERLGVDPCTGLEPSASVGSSSAALTAVESCEDLPMLMRVALAERAREQVLAQRCAVLSTDCSEPESSSSFGCFRTLQGSEDDIAYASTAPPEPGTDSADEYSTTNTQEAGVDEADFVKNDGEYIYVLAGGSLQIIQAWPAADMAVVSTRYIPGMPQALYVFDDRAVVFSYDPSRTCYDSYNYETGSSWYGYGCLPTDAATQITVLDITDRLEPVLERQIDIEGAYVSSRRIDGAVYTVVAQPGPQLPGVRTALPIPACSYEDVEALDADVAELIAQNTRAIAQAAIDMEPPVVRDTLYRPDGTSEVRESLFADCDSILVPSRLSGGSYLTVLAFDIAQEATARASAIVGEQGVVYSSPTSLYVASVDNPGAGTGVESTTIHSFALGAGPATAQYEASGRVGGRVLNQFSMGEYEGDLRIATTTGHLPDPAAYNSVFVLRPSGAELGIIGQLSPIAPTEDIRAARFMGERGFVVTFKKTDPLFVIDLADPTNPTVAGELLIPGFSTYIHMVDADHLLTIGYDAQDMGDFAWFQGIQLQLFDVTDATMPRLMHKHVIGTRGTSSEAATNHLAFNYFRPLESLAIPMAICEGSGSGGTYGDQMTFNGLMVFDVDFAEGFSEQGRIAHDLVASDSYSSGCGHWWTEPGYGVQRSIYMEDFVYSIAHDEIIVAQLSELGTEVASIPLPGTPDGN